MHEGMKEDKLIALFNESFPEHKAAITADILKQVYS